MGASHGGPAQACGARIGGVGRRHDRAARSPDVHARAVVREGRTRVGGSCASDGDCIRNMGWRKSTCVTVLIPSCNNHGHPCAHCCIDGSPHTRNHPTATQAHARNRWTNGTCCQPIQRFIAPRPASASLVTQNLDASDLRPWCNSILGASSSPSAMCSVTLPVRSTSCVTVAFHERATGNIRTGSGSATEVVVCCPHACVENKHSTKDWRSYGGSRPPLTHSTHKRGEYVDFVLCCQPR